MFGFNNMTYKYSRLNNKLAKLQSDYMYIVNASQMLRNQLLLISNQASYINNIALQRQYDSLQNQININQQP